MEKKEAEWLKAIRMIQKYAKMEARANALKLKWEKVAEKLYLENKGRNNKQT